MKKRLLIPIVLALILVLILISYASISNNETTGKVISQESHQIGPSAEEQSCMMTCMGCSSPGVGCSGDQNQCMQQCSLAKPEQTTEEKCVEECASEGCGAYDFSCQSKNQAKCDEECGMIKEPEAKSEEEQCIRDCVNKIQPGLICQAGEGGEKGNEICQKCANDCVYLYAGPCLDDEELKAKQKECETCEHCYGEPVMGDSGEGYECIVDVTCGDSSSEFGDDAGTGEGVFAGIGNAMTNFAESIGNFFKNLFGGSEEKIE